MPSAAGYYVAIALLGASVSTLLGILARYNVHYLMGLVPLFPAFALMAHVMAVNSGNAAGLKAAATFGLYALLPYACYLGCVLLLTRLLPPLLAIALGIVAWIIIAALLVTAWRSGMLPGKG